MPREEIIDNIYWVLSVCQAQCYHIKSWQLIRYVLLLIPILQMKKFRLKVLIFLQSYSEFVAGENFSYIPLTSPTLPHYLCQSVMIGLAFSFHYQRVILSIYWIYFLFIFRQLSLHGGKMPTISTRIRSYAFSNHDKKNDFLSTVLVKAWDCVFLVWLASSACLWTVIMAKCKINLLIVQTWVNCPFLKLVGKKVFPNYKGWKLEEDNPVSKIQVHCFEISGWVPPAKQKQEVFTHSNFICATSQYSQRIGLVVMLVI